MRHAGRGQRHGPGALAIALALTLAILRVPAASEPGPATASGEGLPGAEPPEQIRGRLDALELRVQGMEGKLRESALARKSADQARMEAERRLAEGAQEVERLRQEQQALQAARNRLEERLGGRATEIDRLKAEIQRLQNTKRELERKLAERDADIARLGAELSQASARGQSLEVRLSALQGRVPQVDGGTLTPEAARAAAAEGFAALREARQRQGVSPSAEGARELSSAETLLHRQQLRLVGTVDARSLYPVRDKDTLAQISSRFYGTSHQWRLIFEANRHLLDDPDQLTPGMTLVIP